MTNLNFIILGTIMDLKGLGFILFIAATLAVLFFDKIIKLIIWLFEKFQNKNGK